jgi:hypothetical protein
LICIRSSCYVRIVSENNTVDKKEIPSFIELLFAMGPHSCLFRVCWVPSFRRFSHGCTLSESFVIYFWSWMIHSNTIAWCCYIGSRFSLADYLTHFVIDFALKIEQSRRSTDFRHITDLSMSTTSDNMDLLFYRLTVQVIRYSVEEVDVISLVISVSIVSNRVL